MSRYNYTVFLRHFVIIFMQQADVLAEFPEYS